MVNVKPENRRDVPVPDTKASVTPEIPQGTTLPNFQTDVPRYFPPHSSLRLNSDFGQFQFLKQTDEQLLSIRKVIDKFLDYTVSNPHLLQDENATRFLSSQTEAYGEVLLTKFKLQSVQSMLKTAHTDLIERKRTEDNLGLDNYHTFRASKQQNFGDAIVSQLNNAANPSTPFSDMLRADATYQYLQNIGFVLENPEDPLPDDTTDDELAVSGGKISLKDPLSMDFFTEPVMSKTCKHVFENKHIRQQLQGHSYIHCPITGCEAQVTPRDLQPDKLMELRVKVYQARDKKRESRVRI